MYVCMYVMSLCRRRLSRLLSDLPDATATVAHGGQTGLNRRQAHNKISNSLFSACTKEIFATQYHQHILTNAQLYHIGVVGVCDEGND